MNMCQQCKSKEMWPKKLKVMMLMIIITQLSTSHHVSYVSALLTEK